jgi:hypothetical protein
MRPTIVVVDPKVLGHHLGLEERLDDLAVEQLAPELAAKPLDEGVLPRTPRLDVGAGRTGEPAAHTWGFATYRARHDDYEDSYLPNGMTGGSPEEALDCACGLYLNDPSAWIRDTPTN